MDQLIRVVARDFIDRAVETTLQNSDISGGLVARGEGQECVSEEEVHELVEEAISRLDADGTGLADYANAAVGGSVVSVVFFLSPPSKEQKS